MSDAIDTQTRHITLDALRGFAVMGILAMNIVAFAMPDMAYMSPAIYGGTSTADVASWFASFVLVDGKMRGLFSLLFGASMLLVIERAEAAGQSGGKVHFRRMAWLAVFGLAHFFLIWFGDILFLYAAVGSVAFLFRSWEAKRLIKWAVGFYIAGALLWTAGMGSLLLMQTTARAPGASAEIVEQYKEVMEGPDFAPGGTTKLLKVYRGDYPGIVEHKLKEEAASPFALVLQSILETLPLMMLGMALLKNGFLTGAWESSRYRALAAWTIPLGGTLTFLFGWFVAARGFDLIEALNANLAWTMLPRLVMTLGYAALLVLLIRKLAGSTILERVTAAGRAAFTNYLGTSIVMTTIFYGYGLGLYGHVERVWLWPFVLGAWAGMLLWSKPWLDRFRYGPLEWLWRSLARWEIQPLRR